MAEYGTIYDVNSIKRQLAESNKDYNNRQVWKGLVGSVNNYAAKSNLFLQQNYSEAVNQAYAQYLANQQAIENSGIIGTGKQSLLASNEKSVNDAYNTYMQSFYSGQSSIEEEREAGLTEIDNALTTQATNIKKYADAHFNYLDSLYYNYEQGENQIFDSEQWKKYLVTDADGTTRLATREELLNQLYDSNGNLTLKGLDFFDQMENQNLTDSTFGEYLINEDEDLYNWSQEYNPYNYTFDGTQKGSFKTMVGMASDDYSYSFAERFGGLNEEEITSMYSKFNDTLTRVSALNVETQSDEILNELKTSTTEIFTLAKDLGLEEEFKNQGFNEESMNYILDEAINAVKSGKEMNDEWWTTTLTTAGVGACAGAATGAKLTASATLPLAATGAGTLITVGGTTLGTLIGAIVGFVTAGIAGGTVATINKNYQKEVNTNAATRQKEAYTNMLNQMVNYSLQTRRQAEIEFNKHK